jgi:hypothetical protein
MTAMTPTTATTGPNTERVLHPAHPDQRDRRALVQKARLVSVRVGKLTASERVLRALLFAIEPLEGVPVPSHRLKAESNLGERTVWLGIQALEQIGLLSVNPGKPNTYHIRWDRLTPQTSGLRPQASPVAS